MWSFLKNNVFKKGRVCVSFKKLKNWSFGVVVPNRIFGMKTKVYFFIIRLKTLFFTRDKTKYLTQARENKFLRSKFVKVVQKYLVCGSLRNASA